MSWTLNEAINAAVKKWRVPWNEAGAGDGHSANSYRPGRFTDLSTYKSIQNHKKIGRMLSLEDPFFRTTGGSSRHVDTNCRQAISELRDLRLPWTEPTSGGG